MFTVETAATAAYMVAALLFILALAGLSKHETSKVGNTFGISGMAVALIATIGMTARAGNPPPTDHRLQGRVEQDFPAQIFVSQRIFADFDRRHGFQRRAVVAFDREIERVVDVDALLAGEEHVVGVVLLERTARRHRVRALEPREVVLRLERMVVELVVGRERLGPEAGVGPNPFGEPRARFTRPYQVRPVAVRA